MERYIKKEAKPTEQKGQYNHRMGEQKNTQIPEQEKKENSRGKQERGEFGGQRPENWIS